MKRCIEIRWQFGEFLAGSLDATESETVRRHLEICVDCRLYASQSALLEQHLPAAEAQLPADFTGRLLKSFPQTTPAAAVVRSLAIVFAASAAMAVGVYLVIRDLLAPSVSGESVAAVEAGALARMLEQTLNSPISRYGLLALAAVLICVLVIGVIDRPRQSQSAKMR